MSVPLGLLSPFQFLSFLTLCCWLLFRSRSLSPVVFFFFFLPPLLILSLFVTIAVSQSSSCPLSFSTQFWDKAVDWWWQDSVECAALSGSYPCCPWQSWQCCHGWMNTLFWHRVRQCQIKKIIKKNVLFCQVLWVVRACKSFRTIKYFEICFKVLHEPVTLLYWICSCYYKK